MENRLLNKHGYEFVATGDGFWVSDKNGDNLKQVITQAGEVTDATGGMKSVVIMKPSVSATAIINVEDISGGDVAVPTLVRTTLDYPRNLVVTLVDNASDTLEATANITGTDQFGAVVTESIVVDYDAATTTNGTQIFATITAVTITGVANEAASDTLSVGLSITADVASFGIPDQIIALTDVKSANWIDDGTTKTQNIDATSVVVARSCFRPEQTVAAADDYVIHYIVSRA